MFLVVVDPDFMTLDRVFLPHPSADLAAVFSLCENLLTNEGPLRKRDPGAHVVAPARRGNQLNRELRLGLQLPDPR